MLGDVYSFADLVLVLRIDSQIAMGQEVDSLLEIDGVVLLVTN